MRLYYIFSIKDDIFKITKNEPDKLYGILDSIYKMNKKDVNMAYKLFEKTCNFINKKNISLLLKNLNCDNQSYTCFRDSHLINDFYKNETTKLTVNHSYIFIKSNVIYPKFFNDIRNVKNVFVCDFVNEDYFFLKKINIKQYTNNK